MTENYLEQLSFLEGTYEEIFGYDFYRFIFPSNENEGELHTDFSLPNAIYLYKDEKDEGTKRTLRRRIMLNDTWEHDYKNYVERNACALCGGLSYRRRSNRIQNAQKMNALIIDLDGVGLCEIKNLFLRFGKTPEFVRTLPIPTFFIMSGQGAHLYYVFEEPIDLFPNIKLQLKALKYALTFRVWEYKATSTEKEIQYQSINQGFRMVGSINEKYGTVVKAFRVGGRVTLDYINQYVAPKDRVDVNRPFQPSKMTLEQAKETYPEWYQRVVVEGNKNQNKWDIKGKQGYALYNWWLGRVGEIKGGHRYYFMMCLVIYACKCDVPRKKLKEDLYASHNILKGVEHGNELTERDVLSALETYDREYYNFTIRDIEKLTDIRIERNKRNGRKQDIHLERARAVQEVDYPDGAWRNKDGRPSKKELVEEWRKEHADGKPKECIEQTGLNKNTVYKWWE